MKHLASIIILAAVALVGCEKTIFDVPEDQWKQLTPQQQSQVIDAYNQRKQTETQNAPYMAAIGAASTVLQSKNANTTATMPPM